MAAPSDITYLESLLSQPTPAVVEMMRRQEGDIMVLGVAGKMGPSLARMAKRASDEAGTSARRIIGVSRFRTAEVRSSLEQNGIETITCDLLDANALAALPDAPNIVYMAGMKFGATGQEPLTWAMNTWLPGLICQRFPNSRIAAFSTGNIYGLVTASGPGSREDDLPQPVGEYAQSCLGRERLFEHFAKTQSTKVSLIRLNYACDLRYGVMVDIASKVWQGQPVNVSMGWFNTIWQGDANALALLSLDKATAPAWKVNITGTAKLSVRELALRFGALFGKKVVIEGEETPDALLSDPSRSLATLDKLHMDEQTLLEWVAAWVSQGRALLRKPTHFESRDGKF